MAVGGLTGVPYKLSSGWETLEALEMLSCLLENVGFSEGTLMELMRLGFETGVRGADDLKEAFATEAFKGSLFSGASGALFSSLLFPSSSFDLTEERRGWVGAYLGPLFEPEVPLVLSDLFLASFLEERLVVGLSYISELLSALESQDVSSDSFGGDDKVSSVFWGVG